MPNACKPVLDGKPLLKKTPINQSKPSDEKWCFSFRFWRQIDYFGLDKSESSWFVSLLERLQSLSEENIEGFLKDPLKKDWYRYHLINWSQRNIPVKRKDFDWINSDYLNNEEEYPFVQFQVSQALGRIVGFFDERRVFNILLLDPLHNIQPSKSYNYRVDPCYPLSCTHTLLLDRIDKLSYLRNSMDCKCDCKLCGEIDNIQSDFVPINVVMFSVDEIDIEDAKELTRSGKFTSYAEIFQAGICS